MFRLAADITAFLVPISFCLLGVFVLVKNIRNKLNISFFIYFLTLSILSVGIFGVVTTDSSSKALAWLRLLNLGLVFLPSTLLYFVAQYLESKSARIKYIKYGAFLFSGIFAFLSFTKLFSVGVKKIPFGYVADPGPLFLPFIITAVGLLIFSHLLLYRDYRIQRGYRKNQLKYLFLGSAIFTFGEFLVVPTILNVVILGGFPIWNITSIIYAAILTVAIVKYRLMDIKLAITMVALLAAIYSFVIGIPVYMIIKGGVGLLPIATLFILATIGPILFLRLSEKAGDFVLAGQRRYQYILLRAAEGMVKEHNIERLLRKIVYMLTKTVDLEFAAAYIRQDDEKTYRLRAMSAKNQAPANLNFAYDDHLIEYMYSRKEPFVVEELQKNTAKISTSDGLYVPAFIDDKMIGFLVLGAKKNKEIFNKEDIEVFKTLSYQASLAIANCMYIEEFKKTQERLFTAEKLASIGGMSEGIAHQLRNRLNQFSLGLGGQLSEIEGYIEKHGDKLEKDEDLKQSLSYIQEVSQELTENVKRSEEVINGILNYANVEVQSKQCSKFYLEEILSQAKDLLIIKHRIKSLPLKVEIRGSGLIYCIKSHLLESVFNLLDNSYEAIEEKRDYYLKGDEKDDFYPEIKILFSEEKNGEMIRIDIVDNGIGIKDENKGKIFSPFFTTKSSNISGSGIGMYTVKRLIEERNNGKIRFDSTYGVGTVVTVELPKEKVLA